MTRNSLLLVIAAVIILAILQTCVRVEYTACPLEKGGYLYLKGHPYTEGVCTPMRAGLISFIEFAVRTDTKLLKVLW